MGKISGRKILFISILNFIFLFLILFSYEHLVDIEINKISEITISNINSYVKIKGEIVSLRHHNNMSFFQITDSTGSIDGVIFENKNKKVLTRGETYTFYGKINVYEKELQIIIDEIYEN